MSYAVYILYSKSLDRFYIGQTKDLNKRIAFHLEKKFQGSFTSKANDWGLFQTISCESRFQAIQIECHIKKMKSRQYIQNIKEYPEISDKLKNKYH
jgi:putative endonuclease